MASQDSPPNILFLFTDQQRPDWFEMNPDIPVRTPHLKELSERGVWLTRAICPSPVCGPSRSCVAAGLEYDRCRVWSNDTDFPPELSTYHKRLRDEAGYHVMGAGKFHIGNNQGGNPAEFYFGGDEWESMHVPAKEAADLQRQRQALLYDSEGDERINVAAQFPEVFADLAQHLDEQLGH